MPAPQNVIKLIDRFKEHRASYVAGHYNETQLRREFIDPFFKALGWDIDNEKGKSEAYKDVIHEDAIQIGGVHKAPDYCMRVGGIRKYFVEAKKPSVDIKDDVGPAYQIRRYGWSAKLPLSMLTDFEEFAVYDCRIKPGKSDGSAVARIAYYTVDQLAEKWDEIAAIFSPEAIENGSFDKFAEASKLKRGTQEVDDAFLEEIEEWRVSLAKNIAINNKKLSQRELNFAVQATLDRIIFLRICEDRGVEPDLRLQSETNGAHIYGRLKELFREADERYNSGLFHFEEEKGQAEQPDTLTLNLKIDDDVLKKIISHLYYPESPYAFSVFSADILGQVYERFLGKVIRLTEGHHAKVEEKPEVRKAGGVYYTPTYIVSYIVKHTVGKLLEGKTPKEVAELKIVDPACGSGSFLLGAYQLLLDWHLEWYTEHEPKKSSDPERPRPRACRGRGGVEGWKKELVRSPTGDYRLSTAERKRILLANIFGVDIDSQAVEVTKLSLLLKVLEGESQVSIQDQFAGMRERVLPDLGKNIQCGNSLIGPDFYEGQQQGMFEMDEEEKYRINVFDWESAFPQVFKRKNSGFDAVIGNPPYGAELSEQEVSYLRNKFIAAEYQLDTYPLFINQAHGLLRINGLFGMIIPSAWTASKFNINLRNLLSGSVQLIQMVIAPKDAFEEATVETMILIYSKMKPQLTMNVAVERWDIDDRSKYQIQQAVFRSTDDFVFPIYSEPRVLEVTQKMHKEEMKLGDVADVVWGVKIYQIGKGVPKQTGRESELKIFHSAKKTKQTHRPLIGGSEVKRYALDWDGTFVDYGEWLAEPRTPEWFSGERILIREVTANGKIQAALVSGNFVFSNSVDCIKRKSEQYSVGSLLGILNSKLISFYHLHTSPNAFKGSFPKVLLKDLLSLPLPKFSQSNKEKMDNLVLKMTGLVGKSSNSKTPHEQESLKRQIEATDRQIDQLVYELYGLGEKEIQIIEGAA